MTEYGYSETEMLGAEYDAFSSQHRAHDATHNACDIFNPFGMCGSCDEQYRMGMDAGARDFANGVALMDGFAFWRNSHPEIPRTSCGPLDGYGHGWGRMSLHSTLSLSSVPFYAA
jgi:hypothetical protein